MNARTLDRRVVMQGPIVESDELLVDALEPGGGLLSKRVRRVEYDHVEDEPGAVRVHDFGPGVRLIATPDPRVVLLVHPNLPIWEDF